jgi:hypothetical protein
VRHPERLSGRVETYGKSSDTLDVLVNDAGHHHRRLHGGYYNDGSEATLGRHA